MVQRQKFRRALSTQQGILLSWDTGDAPKEVMFKLNVKAEQALTRFG
jgi:hypothetical protein